MEKKYLSGGAKETKALGKKIIQGLSGQTVLCLAGELGGGKTTFAQGVLEFLGAKKPFTSPTFLVMKEYVLPVQRNQFFDRVYHFDAYRVNAQDVLALGWKEILSNPRNLLLVEWPERIEKILPSSVLWVNFSWIDRDRRQISLESRKFAKNSISC